MPSSAQLAAQARRASVILRAILKAFLLGTETTLTALPFILSWLAAAIFLSIKAGYHVAKAESAEKHAILDRYLKLK